MNKLIIAGLTAEQIRNMLDDDHWAYKLLAQTVCSTYWGGYAVDLHAFGRLCQENWTLQLQSSDIAVKRDGKTTVFTSLRYGARNVTASKNRPDQAFAKGAQM